MAKGFTRKGEKLRCQLDPVEQMLIANLLDELIEALRPGEPHADADPLAVELGLADLGTDAVTSAPDNPVLRRLLPDAYSDDEVAAAEFRRYTDDSLRRSKIADAESLRAGLDAAAADRKGRIEIDSTTADRWLRAINDLRLALGVQLEIDDSSADRIAALGEADPMYPAAMVYDFLTWWQDGLVLALMGD